MTQNAYFFKIKFARACICKKNVVPLHAIYGQTIQTERTKPCNNQVKTT